VKTLRDQTGAGMMDCKRALADAAGDLKNAVEVLRERGLAKAGKREGRATSEGRIAIALSGGTGAMLELGCETDFVARTDEFQAFVRDIAMHIAASNPLALDAEGLDQSTLEAEREIFIKQAMAEGKSQEIAEKIVEGRLKKFRKENALLEQPFVKDPDQTIDQYVQSKIGSLGENMRIRRFARFSIAG
jgi:elongation factor Ts